MKIWCLLACLFVSTACRLYAGLDTGALGRLRGANADCKSLTPGAATTLDAWKCNAVRVLIDADADVAPTEADPLACYQGSLKKLRLFLPAARQHHINVIIGLHQAYQRTYDAAYWGSDESSKKNRAYVTSFWQAFAQEFKMDSAIVAYDLLDGPNDPSDRSSVWFNELLPDAMAAVRAINKDVWLVVEPGRWGAPDGLNDVTPLKDSRVIYGIKNSPPSNYTYQGISAEAKDYRGVLSYPGKMPAGGGEETMVDRESLVASFHSAAVFTAKTHKRVMVLEFGTARWAPGADKWTADMISILEENKWDWMYSVMFGYSGMNPTYDPNEPDVLATEPGRHPTPQFEVLKNAWGKNSD